MTSNGPSVHLAWSELACHDLTRSPYPERWRVTRAIPLAEAFEFIRAECGFPLSISSGYRTEEYNRSIGGALNSQHVQGRALDLHPMSGGTLRELQRAALKARAAGLIVGIGYYDDFVHMDTREGRPATWYGSRTIAQNLGGE